VPVLPPFELVRPASLAEAVDLVAGGGTPYCGGTELLAVMGLGLASPDTLVDLKRVPELGGIAEANGEVRLGARVTHREAAASAAVRSRGAILATATGLLGNSRVRATGTLAGNVCFAEPRSDVLTALLALDARVDLRGPDGTRSVPVGEFVEGAFTTVRADEELVEAIRVPAPSGPSAYVRFAPAEHPTVTVAVAVTRAGCRVVVGAVGERPELFTYPAAGDVDPAAIAGEVDITEDLNGHEDYKRHLTAVFVGRALAQMGVSDA
jgi:carbon-monoxide dehydrogenase medium subunit